MKPEKLDATKIRELLAARGATDAGVFVFGSVNSTNDTAKEYLCSGERDLPAIFAADAQTAGRGRMGRSFFSPDGGL